MRILVTGGAGYIGGTFSYEALKREHEILVLDNFSNSKPSQIESLKRTFTNNFSFEKVDLALEESKLQKIFSDFKPEIVVHFAGLKSVSESQEQPIRYWHNNVVSTANLLKAMVESNTKKIVFSSSATVYGESSLQPIPETAEIKSMSVYGSTKIAIEEMLSDAAVNSIIDVVSLRYFNPVGAHKEKVIFENPFDSPNNIMPRIIRVALGLDEKLQIYGNDYPTNDGSGERDYIHILDLVSGHFAAMDFIKKNSGENIFNLGTGTSTSVYHLIKTFESVNAVKIPYHTTERRKGDVAICYADPIKAEEILNWKTKYTLNEMCKDAWEGVKDHGLN